MRVTYLPVLEPSAEECDDAMLYARTARQAMAGLRACGTRRKWNE